MSVLTETVDCPIAAWSQPNPPSNVNMPMVWTENMITAMTSVGSRHHAVQRQRTRKRVDDRTFAGPSFASLTASRMPGSSTTSDTRDSDRISGSVGSSAPLARSCWKRISPSGPCDAPIGTK